MVITFLRTDKSIMVSTSVVAFEDNPVSIVTTKFTTSKTPLSISIACDSFIAG